LDKSNDIGRDIGCVDDDCHETDDKCHDFVRRTWPEDPCIK
jgi:hypothetical protein